MNKDEKIIFDELNAKGVEAPDQNIYTPEELKEVEIDSKPLISFNLSDRWNQLKKWLISNLVESGIEIASKLIPFWVWIVFVIGLLAMFYFKAL